MREWRLIMQLKFMQVVLEGNQLGLRIVRDLILIDQCPASVFRLDTMVQKSKDNKKKNIWYLFVE